MYTCFNAIFPKTCLVLEQGPAATGKDAISEQGSQRKQYLKRPRRESSTTAFKEATTTRGLSYPHKEKRSNGPRYRRQRTEGSGTCTHDQFREAWKTAESSGVTESGYSKYRYVDCH